MLHTSPFGVATNHPFYEIIKEYQLLSSENKLIGWRLNKNHKTAHSYIHPASQELLDNFINELELLKEQFPYIDAIHLDANHYAGNYANGLVNNKNAREGNIWFHKELNKQFPELVFSGEKLNETSIKHIDLIQRHYLFMGILEAHPISTYLLDDDTHNYGHLSLSPINRRGSSADFYTFFTNYEFWGIIPTIAVHKYIDLMQIEIPILLNWAAYYAKEQLKPDFSYINDNIIFQYRTKNDKIVKLIRTDSGTLLLDEHNEVIYQHIYNTDYVKTDNYLTNWIAQDNKSIYGLNPDKHYLLSKDDKENKEAKEEMPIQITKLNKGITISEYYFNSLSSRLSLENLTGEVSYNFIEHIPEAKCQIKIDNKMQAFGKGASWQAGIGTCDNIKRKSIFAHPPYKQTNGEIWATYSLTLSDEENLLLEFYSGIQQSAKDTDGITFIILINGIKIFEEHITEKVWKLHHISLDKYAGDKINITFINTPGPNNDTSFDWARWGEPHIIKASTNSTEINIHTDEIPIAYFPKEMKRIRWSKQNYTLKGDLPISLGFIYQYETIETPCNLLEYNPTITPLPISEKFSPLTNITCGGINKKALKAHPPEEGKNIIQYAIKIPKQNANKLTFNIGIADNSKTSGVTFKVLINGAMLWSHNTKEVGWTSGNIDIKSYNGEIILLELITEAGENNHYDWAYWSDIKIN